MRCDRRMRRKVPFRRQVQGQWTCGMTQNLGECSEHVTIMECSFHFSRHNCAIDHIHPWGFEPLAPCLSCGLQGADGWLGVRISAVGGNGRLGETRISRAVPPSGRPLRAALGRRPLDVIESSFSRPTLCRVGSHPSVLLSHVISSWVLQLRRPHPLWTPPEGISGGYTAEKQFRLDRLPCRTARTSRSITQSRRIDFCEQPLFGMK